MNETKKTGIFWGVAAVVVVIASIVAWPSSSSDDSGTENVVGTPLFSEFKDPLVASSLKIVTFNEGQGELKNFEVRKGSETGLWTIPSKGGYPADAVEQMRDAANALVDLKILDVPTDNPQDHAGMGVVEPKLEDLNPGDEGIGRMVTFKDKTQNVLASVIIGNSVKGQEGQLYVRKPGQDPVYVVALDDKPLTTNFQDWIQEDLLQLSSIDIENVEIKDYNASLGIQGVSLSRNSIISLSKDGSTWNLDALKEYDKANPLADPKQVDVDPTKKLADQKLNDLANALDDLKFVDVKRKPDGISANLKTNKDFTADKEAASQLASRGFIPVPMGPNREIEILSANGEVTATTKDGVQYILRFGNISGISEGDDAEKSDGDSSGSAGGVNRYLMVSTIVNQSKFPAPDLQPIPATLEDLDALDKPAPPADLVLPTELNAPETDTDGKDTAAEPEMKEGEAKEDAVKEKPAKEEATEEAKPDEKAAEETPAGKEAESGETDASGEGESTTVGEGQEPADGDQQAPADEKAAEKTEPKEEKPEASPEASDTKPEPAEKTEAAAEPAKAEMKETPASEPAETQKEKEERLANVQEKIQKENDRKMEDRKEKLERAALLSKALNERFADWYYVIPEDTYSKLRISQDDLFESADAAAAPNPAAMPPGFGLPQGFPGN